MASIVYRTENTVNGKFYYGVRNLTGTRHDKYYLGSGLLLKKAIEKYGRENFVRRTVMEFETHKEAMLFEKLIVDKDFVDRDDCYNLCVGGEGGYKGGCGFKGKSQTDESKKKISESKKGQRSGFAKYYWIKENTGEVFQTLTQAHKNCDNNMKLRTFRAQLDGQNPNRTGFIRVRKEEVDLSQ